MTGQETIDAWKAKIAEIDASRLAIISKLNEVGQSVPTDGERKAAGKDPVRLHEIQKYLKNIFEYNTLTFDAAGGRCTETSRKVLKGESIGTLPDATKDGSTLLGWFTSASGGEQYNSQMKITSDRTAYAQWISSTFAFRKCGSIQVKKGSEWGYSQYANDDIAGGFGQTSAGQADASCLRSTARLNFADNLELVFLVRTGDDVQNNQEVFSGSENDHNEFGVVSGRFMWELNTGSAGETGTHECLPNTWYWMKVVKAEGQKAFTCYVSLPNGDESTYMLDATGSRTTSVNKYVAIGIDDSVGGDESFKGLVNLTKSYIKVNGQKIQIKVQE